MIWGKLEKFRDILLQADPKAQHYRSTRKGNYTCWAEFRSSRYTTDNGTEDIKWFIQVDRFTKIEYDPMVEAIDAVLDRDDVAASYDCDHELDTGYIHHFWTCEVI